MFSIRTAAAAAALVAPLVVAAPAGAGHDGSTPHARTADDSCPAGQVRPAHFADVDGGNAHAAAIDCVVWWGVAGGRTITDYAPAPDVRRDQMATFLRNLILRSGGTLPTPTKDHFGDDDASPHQDSINALAEAGIVSGKGAGYAPDAPVERGQMATFLVNAYEFRAEKVLPEPAGDVFADDDDSTHEVSTNQAALAGFAAGVGEGRYAPRQLVHRDQMASFLSRVLDLLVEDGVASPPPVRAGDFDLSFGTGGVSRLQFPDEDADGDPPYAEAHDVALGADGSMALAGVTNGRFAVAKTHADGTPDTTFSGDGLASTDFLSYAQAAAVLLQPDGKVVAGGFSPRGADGAVTDFTVVRYNDDGSLDTGFGGDGIVTTAFADRADVRELVLQPDGAIVAAGTTVVPGQTPHEDVVLVRYRPDGSLDASFGTGGVVTVDRGGSDSVSGLVLLDDGALVTAGVSSRPEGGASVTLVRVGADGTSDPSFGDDGAAQVQVTGNGMRVNDLAVQPDGSLVVAGLRRNQDHADEVLLTRFTADGAHDTGFGENGFVVTAPTQISEAAAVTAQPDGRLVVAGRAAHGWMGNTIPYQWLAQRYLADGSLDTSFGDQGSVVYRLGKSANAVALTAEGGIVAAGCDCPEPASGRGGFDATTSFVVARLLGEAPAAV